MKHSLLCLVFLIVLLVVSLLNFQFTPIVSAGGTTELWVDGYTAQINNWTKVGSDPYLNAIDASYVWNSTDLSYISRFNYSDSTQAGTLFSVQVCVYAKSPTAEKLEVSLYNSTSVYIIYTVTLTSAYKWYNLSCTSTLPSWTEVNSAQLRLKNVKVGGAGEVDVDASMLKVVFVPPPGDYWLSGWNRRRALTFSNATGAGTNYQVKITAVNGTGTDTYDTVYVDNKTKTDFSDVNFTGSDGITSLEKFNETCYVGKNATFWVKIKEDMSSANSTIYMYYNRPDATYISSGDNVFLAFHDMDTDHTGWIYVESGTSESFGNQIGSLRTGGTDGILNFSGARNQNTKVYKSVSSTTAIAIEAKVKVVSSQTQTNWYNLFGISNDLLLSSSTDFGIYEGFTEYPSRAMWRWDSGGYSSVGTGNLGLSAGTWYTQKFTRNSTGFCKEEVWDGFTYKGQCNFTWATTAITYVHAYIGEGEGTQTQNNHLDWIFARKYADADPYLIGWGIEETEQLPPMSKKDLGLGINAGHSIYYNGSKEAIYVAFQNQSFSTWKFQVKAFDMNTSTWTSTYNITDCWANDGHLTPSISVLWDGRLIYFAGYNAPLHYWISTYSANLTSSPETVISSWSEERTINYSVYPNSLDYPNPIRFDDRVVVFGRAAGNYGNYTMIAANSSQTQYGYVNLNDSTYQDWTFTGNQPYLWNTYSDYITASLALEIGKKAGNFYFDDFDEVSSSLCINSFVSETWLEIYMNNTNTFYDFNVTYETPSGTITNTISGYSQGWLSFNVTSKTSSWNDLTNAKIWFTVEGAAGGDCIISKARLKVVYSGFSVFQDVLTGMTGTSGFYPEVSKSGSSILLSTDITNETDGSEQNVYFLYSPDKGVTWKNVSGSALTLPVNISTANVLAYSSSHRTRVGSSLIDENNKTIVPFTRLDTSVSAYQLNSPLSMVQYSTTLGSAGSWTAYNITDENGNLTTTSLEFIMFNDPFFKRPAIWLIDNTTDYISKYVREIGELNKFRRAVNDTSDKIFFSNTRGMIRDAPEAYEVLMNQYVVDAGTMSIGTAQENVNTTTIWGCKFNATKTAIVTQAQMRGNASAPQNAYWKSVIYHDSNMSLLAESSSYYIITGAAGVGWLQACPFPTKPTIYFNNTYWICLRINSDNISYYSSPSTVVNQTFSYTLDYATSAPSTIAPTYYYNRTITILAQTATCYVRGLGVDEYEMSFSNTGTNTTQSNSTCDFHSYVEDKSGLLYANFRTNNTGSWINDTYLQIGGVADWANFTEVLNDTKVTVAWEILANDTNNNLGTTGTQYLILAGTLNFTGDTSLTIIENSQKTLGFNWQAISALIFAIICQKAVALIQLASVLLTFIAGVLKAITLNLLGTSSLAFLIESTASLTIVNILNLFGTAILTFATNIQRAIVFSQQGLATITFTITSAASFVSVKILNLFGSATVTFITNVLRTVAFIRQGTALFTYVVSGIASFVSAGILHLYGTATITFATNILKAIEFARFGVVSIVFTVNGLAQAIQAGILYLYGSAVIQFIIEHTLTGILPIAEPLNIALAIAALAFILAIVAIALYTSKKD